MNVECDENNGFHAEQFVSSVVGDEAPSQATSTMGIGHILPQETPHVHVEEEGVRAPLVDPPQGKSSPQHKSKMLWEIMYLSKNKIKSLMFTC